MSQRDSGYARVERDCYETPEWVTECLLPHLRKLNCIWEPACGSGRMARVLSLRGSVLGTDIAQGHDFLIVGCPAGVEAIITNPPYSLAEKFINTALINMRPQHSRPGGLCAFLLRADYDSAAGRKYLFTDRAFAKKLTLTRRIVWFERKGAAPSFNHAWFIWDWQHEGAPTLAYAP